MSATADGQSAMDPENNRLGDADGISDADGTSDADSFSDIDDSSGVGPVATARRIVDRSPRVAIEPGTAAAERIAVLRARLVTPMPDDRLWGWIGPLLVTLFAGWLRFYRLSVPNAVIFDETYYAKDAWSILKHGVEWNWIGTPTVSSTYVNNQIVAGHFTETLFQKCTGTGCGEYVVQPELGKLLIAVGEWMYGLTTLGWRFASAVFGTLAILLMCRVARRLTRSTLLGCIAGLLLSLDGLELVLSRTGILDIFLMFFVLASFGALIVDRDVSRSRLAEAMVLRPGDDAGPWLGMRKWRVLAGIMLGFACASKQYGVWYILAFAALCIAWDAGARRTVGLRRYWHGALVRDGKWLPVTLGLIPLVTYLLTWLNWFFTNTGYDRDYAQQHGINIPVISQLYSLYEYHKEMLQFGVGLNAPHPYESQPWDWFVISRPVAFYWQTYTDPAGLHVETKANVTGPYVREVLTIGNPAIWWLSIPAIVFCLTWWLTHRDWRAGAAVFGLAAGWVTWLPFVSRTKFYYYALEFEPFIIFCIVLCLGLILGSATAIPWRRWLGSGLVALYVVTVVILFFYFYPILTGEPIPYQDWLSHMWYQGLFGPAHGWI
jgi:dolichyl-phosphate-mannose-protein mannosyltransferase